MEHAGKKDMSVLPDLPPAGSRRRRFVVGFWAAFSIVFLSLSGYRFVEWRSVGGEFPVMATIGGVLGLIGVWRWIVERMRDR
jgi:hypothetical protein